MPGRLITYIGLLSLGLAFLHVWLDRGLRLLATALFCHLGLNRVFRDVGTAQPLVVVRRRLFHLAAVHELRLDHDRGQVASANYASLLIVPRLWYRPRLELCRDRPRRLSVLEYQHHSHFSPT
jgi:hypothetical protein